MKAKSTTRRDSAASSPARAAANARAAKASPSSTSSTSKSQQHQQLLQCANCGTSTTPVWRRDTDKRRLCNACGLYFKSHKTSRGNEVARPGSQPSPVSLPGASMPIQLPVIPRWPSSTTTTFNSSSSALSDKSTVPSATPQRSHSFAGTTASSNSSPFFSGYKLAPMGVTPNHGTPGGMIDDLPPIALASSSLTFSGQLPALYGGGSSWSGSSPSSSSSPSTPPYTYNFYGGDDAATPSTVKPNQQQQSDFIGASLGAGVRPISSFFRQNSLPTYLSPLQTSLDPSSTSSTASLSTRPSSGAQPNGDTSSTSSTSGTSTSGSTTSWFIDGLDNLPPPPATASSSYSTTSSLSSSSSTPASLTQDTNAQEPFFTYSGGPFEAFAPISASFSIGPIDSGLNGAGAGGLGGWSVGVGDKLLSTPAGALNPTTVEGEASPPTTMEPQMMFANAHFAY